MKNIYHSGVCYKNVSIGRKRSGQNTRTESVIQVSQLLFLYSQHNSIFLAQDVLVRHFGVQDGITVCCFFGSFLFPLLFPSFPRVYFEERSCLKYPMGNLHRLLLVAVMFWNLSLGLKSFWYLSVLDTYLVLHSWRCQKQSAISYSRFVSFPSSSVAQMSLLLVKNLN